MGLLKKFRDTITFARHRLRNDKGHTALGQFGEDLAVNALLAEGYSILERNAVIYGREVDIIAIEKELLVFIEVKTRSNHSFGKPLQAVDNKRRKRYRKAGDLYLVKKKLKNTSLRFDVVTVDFTGGDNPEVTIIRNAF